MNLFECLLVLLQVFLSGHSQQPEFLPLTDQLTELWGVGFKVLQGNWDSRLHLQVAPPLWVERNQHRDQRGAFRDSSFTTKILNYALKTYLSAAVCWGRSSVLKPSCACRTLWHLQPLETFCLTHPWKPEGKKWSNAVAATILLDFGSKGQFHCIQARHQMVTACLLM